MAFLANNETFRVYIPFQMIKIPIILIKYYKKLFKFTGVSSGKHKIVKNNNLLPKFFSKYQRQDLKSNMTAKMAAWSIYNGIQIWSFLHQESFSHRDGFVLEETIINICKEHGISISVMDIELCHRLPLSNAQASKDPNQCERVIVKLSIANFPNVYYR